MLRDLLFLWLIVGRLPLAAPWRLVTAQRCARCRTRRAQLSMRAAHEPDTVAELLNDVPAEALPRHLAVVMDGNSRWARDADRPIVAGHVAGVEALRMLVRNCASLEPLRELTVFAFSAENWGRPAEEVTTLLSLIERVLRAEADSLFESGVRVRFTGDLERLPEALRELIRQVSARAPPPAERLVLCIALSYGGRQEITRAARELCERVLAGELVPSEVDDALFADTLRGLDADGGRTDGKSSDAARISDCPANDPDLLLRTGGQRRLSNFLLYQCAYTELAYTDVLWPDFDTSELARSLREYARRQRTFGIRHV